MVSYVAITNSEADGSLQDKEPPDINEFHVVISKESWQYMTRETQGFIVETGYHLVLRKSSGLRR